MVNEAGRFPEVCKKSLQAQAGDMAGPITEESLRQHPLTHLARLSSAQLEGLGRIAFPLIAEEDDTHFRRIPWEDALERASAGLQAAGPQEVFFYSSGRSSNEAAFLMQVVARAWGTQNINNCSYYCHNASGVALTRVYGSGTASIALEDLEEADLAVVAGANPASNHPRLITQLVNLRRRRGKVIIVNPLRELGLVRFRVPSDWRSLVFGSTISDVYLQPHVGSDIALFTALLKAVVESGGADDYYIDNYTIGWDAVERSVTELSWASLIEACGISRHDIQHAAEIMIEAKRGILCWAMGLTHHLHGTDNIIALSNIALARGWLGRPGCGLLPIRGHSNVQGVGSVGVTPNLKAAFAAKMEEIYGIAAGKEKGMTTFESMQAAAEGRVGAAFMLGGNLFASNPDRYWAAAAMKRIPLTIYLSTKLNEGHVHGRGRTSLILPVLARDEEAQTTTQESMFNFVRLSEGGTPVVEGNLRSEVDIIASLAERILPRGRFDWAALRSHRHLREQIARIVPGYEPLARIDEGGAEFHIEGRSFHEPRFATVDRKAHFHVAPLPDFSPGADEFRLMTLRSEGQFNTVVYEEEDLYRGNTRRDVVMMAEEDACGLGLQEGDRVHVRTDTGVLEVTVSVADIRSGNLAMYYPEANVLVPRRVDEHSGTPAFKSVLARVVRVT